MLELGYGVGVGGEPDESLASTLPITARTAMNVFIVTFGFLYQVGKLWTVTKGCKAFSFGKRVTVEREEC